MNRGLRGLVLAVLAVSALAAVACGSDAEPTIPTVTVTAADFSFSLPATLEGGLTRLQLVNTGQDSHHMQLLKLNEGVSQQQFQETVQGVIQAIPQEGEAALFGIFAVAALAGGPSGALPGAQSASVMDLKPGEYALVCFLAGADGIPHVAKGMVASLTVTEPKGDPPPEPEALASVDLIDFAILGAPITLAAGESTLKVTNRGQEPHELTLLKLEGITAEQALGILMAPPGSDAPSGPPPFKDAGGLQAIMPGETGWTILNLEPGNYIAVCFVPSPVNDFAPHVALGMLASITVQ